MIARLGAVVVEQKRPGIEETLGSRRPGIEEAAWDRGGLGSRRRPGIDEAWDRGLGAHFGSEQCWLAGGWKQARRIRELVGNRWQSQREDGVHWGRFEAASLMQLVGRFLSGLSGSNAALLPRSPGLDQSILFIAHETDV